MGVEMLLGDSASVGSGRDYTWEKPGGLYARLRARPTVEARYENGFLKPTGPLKHRQGEKVAVIVLRHPDPTRRDMKRIAADSAEDETLAASGLDSQVDALDSEDRR